MDILNQVFKVGIVCMDIFANEEIPGRCLLLLILGNINFIELNKEEISIMKSLKTHKG